MINLMKQQKTPIYACGSPFAICNQINSKKIKCQCKFGYKMNSME